MSDWRGISAIFIATFLCLSTHLVQAWDYERHRLINDLALDTLPQSFPQFVLTAENRERIRFLAGEPDRWRNTRDRALRHLNNPDHYFDVEYLAQYELKTKTLSHFRYRFVEQMAAARARLKLELPEGNTDHLKGHPGFMPWSINEHTSSSSAHFPICKSSIPWARQRRSPTHKRMWCIAWALSLIHI